MNAIEILDVRSDSLFRLLKENERLRMRLAEVDPEFSLNGEITIAACGYRRDAILKELELCGAK